MTRLGQTVATLTRRQRDAARPVHDRNTRMIVKAASPNPGALKMLVHIPVGLGAGAPLVVVLHGCTQTGEAYAEGAGWLTLADRFGFAVLCPEQTTANNPNRCFNWFQTGDTTRDAGEAASIAAMTRQMIADHQIDPDRVFVTGLSAGGAMTAVMLATYPEMFAAGAVMAGLAYGSASSVPEAFEAMMQAPVRPGPSGGDRVRQASSHRGPWPAISIWHGTRDATVRPAAGELLLQQWLDVHDLCSGPETAQSEDGRSSEMWKTPDGRSVVEMHRIAGMGHGTPLRTGGTEDHGKAGPFLLDVGISSSLEMARTWGLAPPVSAPSGTGQAAVGPDPVPGGRALAPVVLTPKVIAPERNSITDVIETALRAAGLMR